jgi:hypothetical protein
LPEGSDAREFVRLPDFIILGPMKGGTTTLFRWLEAHPDTWLPARKEPHFFAEDHEYAKGLSWYSAMFRDANERLTGEASVRYSDPKYAPKVARRLRSDVPDAKLIFIHRAPDVRLRSHYRHEVQRGREHRSFSEALRDPGNPYVRQSLYGPALAPFRATFGPQLLEVDFEDLFGSDDAGYGRVLRFLGLSDAHRPHGVHNVSAGKAGFRGWTGHAYRSRYFSLTKQVPGPLRRALKPLALRANDDRKYLQLLETAHEPLPPETRRLLASAR